MSLPLLASRHLRICSWINAQRECLRLNVFISSLFADLLGGEDALGLDRMGALQDAIRAEMHIVGAEAYTSSRLWRRVESSTHAALAECRKALGKHVGDEGGTAEDAEDGEESEPPGTDEFRDWYVEAFLRGFGEDLEQLESEEGRATDPEHIVAMLDEGKDAYSEAEKLMWLGKDASSSPVHARSLLG